MALRKVVTLNAQEVLAVIVAWRQVLFSAVHNMPEICADVQRFALLTPVLMMHSTDSMAT